MEKHRKEAALRLQKIRDNYLKMKSEGTLPDPKSKISIRNEKAFKNSRGRTSPIFIHIPKTGGRYLSGKMKECKIDFTNPGHNSALNAKNYLRGNWDERFSFACVRNPYERFLSACVFNNVKDFEEISNQLAGEGLKKTKLNKHFETQKSLLTDKDGKILVNYIGRFEKFNEFIEGLKERGIDVTNKHEFKKSRSSDWKTRLTEKTKKNIRKIYKEDFKMFNYKMQDK